MEYTSTCPACGVKADQGWPALVAPFIAEYLGHDSVAGCCMLECGTCAHRFFNLHFSEAESERLYADYRGPSYFEVRHRHEPWYTETYNRSIGHDPVRVAARKASLSAFLASAGLSSPLESVLDFGGDAGQLIPVEWARERYVHDLSGVPAAEGVHMLARDEDLQGRTFDLVLLTHVLEHVSDPLALMTRIRHLLPEEAGHAYVEVPLERPWVGFLGRSRAMIWYLDRLRTRPKLLRLVDFYSSAFRIKAGFFPPFGFPKLHEHINFFSPESLQRLLERAGFRITLLREVAASGQGKLDALACLVAPNHSRKAQ